MVSLLLIYPQMWKNELNKSFPLTYSSSHKHPKQQKELYMWVSLGNIYWLLRSSNLTFSDTCHCPAGSSMLSFHVMAKIKKADFSFKPVELVFPASERRVCVCILHCLYLSPGCKLFPAGWTHISMALTKRNKDLIHFLIAAALAVQTNRTLPKAWMTRVTRRKKTYFKLQSSFDLGLILINTYIHICSNNL